jgi:hypothetical protein
MKHEFDLTGFVNFPNRSNFYSNNHSDLKKVDSGRTQVYLVAFGGNSDCGIEFEKRGNFCGDDVTLKKSFVTFNKQINDVIKEMTEEEGYMVDTIFFKDSNKLKLDSCILLGWSNFSYEYTERLEPWCCTFRDLTDEGRKLYYSLKKLHNNSEIRILTFNNIK